MRKDCFNHADSHLFNMLVQGRTHQVPAGEVYRVGDVAIIDWEFSQIGPLGKDFGSIVAYPVACCFMHAVNGDFDSSNHVLNWIDQFWERYSSKLILGDYRNGLTLADVYRTMLGFMSIWAVAYDGLGIHLETWDIDEAKLVEVKSSLGMVSLASAFGIVPEDATLEEMLKIFHDVVRGEMDYLLALKL